MTEIARHIGNLLTEHPCVIVPHLGGFVAQYVPATIADGQFLPPRRTVSFNPRLTMNDGLLVQAFMQHHAYTYSQTTRLVDAEVDTIKRQLRETGAVDLDGIGRLSLSLDGRYNFEPSELGIGAPDLYGLDAFSLPQAAPLKPQAQGSQKATAESHREKSAFYTIRINRELVNYVAAAVIAVFFYFAWATPLVTYDNTPSQAAIVQSTHVFAPGKGAASTAKPAAERRPAAESAAQVSPRPAEKAAAKPTAASEPVADSAPYTIVLASQVSEKNAAALVERLTRQGFPDGRVSHQRMTRVIYGHYPTQAAAYNALRRLQANDLFAEGWVMKN